MIDSQSKSTILVGIAQMQISKDPSQILSAPNLGSCLGIAVYDCRQCFGGLIHCLLPLSSSDPVKAKERPCMYVDSGLSLLLEKMFELGSQRNDLKIVAAGGAAMGEDTSLFEIGKRNTTVLRKLLWKNNFLLSGQDMGGATSRTVSLHLDSGQVWLKALGQSILMS